MKRTPPPPTVPPIEWPDGEVQKTVLLSNQTSYSRFMAEAQWFSAEAQRLASEAEKLSRETTDAKQRWEEFRQKLDDTLHQQRVADNEAGIKRRSAQGFAVALATLGGQVPAAPTDGVRVHPPERDVPAQEHAAQYGGPLPENQAAAMNAFQALHNQQEPRDPDPLGLRALALKQHPYVDPTPTGAHPLARPEGEAR